MKEAIERRKAMEAEWAALGHPATPCVGHGHPGLNCPAPEVHAQKAAERERDFAALSLTFNAQESEAKMVLRGLVASLERVRDQRSASAVNARGLIKAHVRGEIAGLTIAINAIKRRLRP